MVRQRGLGRVVVFVVGLFDAIVNCHGPAGTVAILATAPIGDIFVVVAADLVVPIAVKN